MDMASILWRRLDRSGHDFCLLQEGRDGWHLSGTAIFSEHQVPCRLDYDVLCDAEWMTLGGTIRGWLGDRSVSIEIIAAPSDGWRLNGTSVPATRDCVDLDLSFTPSTNLIPVRRLDLRIGSSAPSRAAWLAFPEMELKPLEQTYCRKDRQSYRYSVANGYSADLNVDEAGFVTFYQGQWEAAAAIP